MRTEAILRLDVKERREKPVRRWPDRFWPESVAVELYDDVTPGLRPETLRSAFGRGRLLVVPEGVDVSAIAPPGVKCLPAAIPQPALIVQDQPDTIGHKLLGAEAQAPAKLQSPPALLGALQVWEVVNAVLKRSALAEQHDREEHTDVTRNNQVEMVMERAAYNGPQRPQETGHPPRCPNRSRKA